MTVTPPPDGPGAGRAAAAAGLALALVAAATLVTTTNDRLPADLSFGLPWYVLLGLYVVAGYYTLGFQRREGSVLVVLVQLPLALGVVLVAPLEHLGSRLLAVAVVDLVLRRRGALKTVVNLAIAGVEVATATGLLTLLHPAAEPGPALWASLLLVLLAAEIASSLVLQLVFLVLGMPRTRRDLLEPLAFQVTTTTVFAFVAVLTLASAWTDASTLFVVVALAGALGMSYRAYRRLQAEQRATEELYAFVKVLEPVDVEQRGALVVLEHVRELLHAKDLELAVADHRGGLGTCLSVHLDGASEVREGRLQHPGSGPDLQGEGMTTPLVVGGSFLGILTARRRVTSDRGFDMKDLRLFETVATELATAVDRGRLLRDLERAASTDPMTGLPNLHRVTQGLAAMLAAHDGVLVAAVAVDSFREVNDTLGHPVGDDLLREVAARLRAVAPTALIGRIGGGRFAVAVPAEAAGGDIGLFGLALRSQVEGSAQLGPVSTHVRLSVGCVRAPEHGVEAATLLRRAETAMYSARAVHGGPVVWEPAYEVQGNRRLAVVTALREALATGAIGTAYQVKVSTRTGAVTGVEALARWTHTALGEVDPVEFVPLAEAAGLMDLLTSTVLGQALAACAGRRRPGRRVGQRQLRHPAEQPVRHGGRRGTALVRGAAGAADPGAHRGRGRGRPRSGERAHARAPRAGGAAVRGRLRHGLLLADLPQGPARRRGQDRQGLRRRRRGRRRRPVGGARRCRHRAHVGSVCGR